MHSIDDLDNLLTPLNLHRQLERCLLSDSVKLAPISIVQVLPNSLRFGNRLQKAFERLGTRIDVQSKIHVAKKGTDHQKFLNKVETSGDDFILLQVHGAEGEERLLEAFIEKDFPGKLIVIIHRPEEIYLRIAKEDKITLTDAKEKLRLLLCGAEAIVLPGRCSVGEYRRILTDAVVVSVPLDFAKSSSQRNRSWRFRKNAVICVGSNTTWGEMRHIDDVLKLYDAIKSQRNEEKIFGYVLGKFDSRAKLSKYARRTDVCLLSNLEIETAYINREFLSEQTFREWLHKRAKGRVIIRGREDRDKVRSEHLDKRNDELYAWERNAVDFNVQLYHEIMESMREDLDPGRPKIEYSGTLHKGKPHELFVVFDSPSMKDVENDEGFKMIQLRRKNGIPDYKSLANRIIYLINNPDERLEIAENNRRNKELLSADEIAFGYYLLMQFLKKREALLAV